jgi:NADH-quinone oxidoreductase subunit N
MMNSVNWMTALPEIFLLSMACVITLVDLWVKSKDRTLTYLLTLATLLAVALMHAMNASTGQTVYGFGQMVVSDAMGNWLKCIAALSVLVTLIYSRPYASQRKMLEGGELFLLSMFSLLGMSVMISGNNFLVIYLGLELLTLSSYALVALRRDNGNATEAAMKYFVLGALASGFLLYGLSMIYGATGSLELSGVFQAISSGHIRHQVLVLGVVFVVCGIAFKLGAAPFHMWVPDIYQGAPTAVTLMIAAAPKLAAFAMMMRLLVDGMLPLAIDWQQMMMVLAVLSLLIGNLSAIAQTNLKRMLAFSTIAQMGFVLIGMLSGVNQGNTLSAANAYSSAMFYMITYVITTLGVFGVILLLAREGFESEEISDLAGLNQRSPLFAGVMAMCLFSLAGVLQALLASEQISALVLAVFAVMMSLVGAFYYLRVIKVMYFDPPLTVTTVSADRHVKAVLAVNGGLVLVLGVLPGGLMSLCAVAVVQALGT